MYNPILHTEGSKGLHRHKNTLKNKVTYIVKQEFKKQASHHKYTRTQTYKYINKNKPYMRSKHGNVRKETILGVTKAESICDIDKGDMRKGLIHLIPTYG